MVEKTTRMLMEEHKNILFVVDIIEEECSAADKKREKSKRECLQILREFKERQKEVK